MIIILTYAYGGGERSMYGYETPEEQLEGKSFHIIG